MPASNLSLDTQLATAMDWPRHHWQWGGTTGVASCLERPWPDRHPCIPIEEDIREAVLPTWSLSLDRLYYSEWHTAVESPLAMLAAQGWRPEIRMVYAELPSGRSAYQYHVEFHDMSAAGGISGTVETDDVELPVALTLACILTHELIVHLRAVNA